MVALTLDPTQTNALRSGATMLAVPMKPQPDDTVCGFPYWHIGGYRIRHDASNQLLPPFAPGDRVPCKERWQPTYADGFTGGKVDWDTGHGLAINYPATDGVIEYYDESSDDAFCDKVSPARTMPIWAIRTHVTILSVRPVRVEDVTEADALALRFWVHVEKSAPQALRDYWTRRHKGPWLWLYGVGVETI